MLKRIFGILAFASVSFMLAAQPDMMIMGTTPGLHLQHTIVAKENWYSVGRTYNLSPKEIAPFNGLTLESPLSIGQQIRIPLTASNFSQNGSRMDDEAHVPLYHTVQEKEWMYRISTTYNKVPVENLEKWNNITKDDVKPGMKLIVGYLKVKKDQSALTDKSVLADKTNSPALVKSKEKKVELVLKQDVIQEPQITSAEEKKATETKAEAIKPAEEKPLPVKVATQPSTSNAEGGYFKTLYEETGKTSSGSAGVFKSTSGWQDGKYYALMNNVPIGMIVKVSNPSTSKMVYAKVLGQLPEMKESAGLTVRISDAAASELGANANKFVVELKY